MKNEPNFFGKENGYYWWVGTIESRLDPLKLGRLRVRVLGAHTEIKALIPTCALHWMYFYQPTTWNQGMNGLGHSPTGPAEGTWCGGFFKDGSSAQDGIVTFILAGIPEEAPKPCLGFGDPGEPHHEVHIAPRKIRKRYYPNDGTGAQLLNESIASLYPRETHPWGCIIGEPDTNRLARAELVDDTIIGVRKRQRDVCIPIAFAHPKPVRRWNEPLPSYNARYPYNHVYESESGHILEFDDTPFNERIHLYHRAGTYIEIQGSLDGDFVMKIVGERFEVTMENSYAHFQNTMNVTIDGEANIYCRSDANLQVDGNLNVHVRGDVVEKVHGNYYIDIDGNRVVKVGGTDSLSVGKGYTVAAGSTITESAGGHFSLTSGAELSGDAPSVHWNSGHSTTATPAAPVVPPFPDPLYVWKETRNECGPDPAPEIKPNPNPATCPQEDC
jgi:hypothetical protein